MKVAAAAVIVACVVLVVSSCASTARPARPHMEMFDSRARGGGDALPLSAVLLPLPDVPPAGAFPAASAQGGTAAPPAVGAAGLDAGLSVPLRPVTRSSFALAAPVAPPVTPAAVSRPPAGRAAPAPVAARPAKPGPAAASSPAVPSLSPASAAMAAAPASVPAGSAATGSAGQPGASALAVPSPSSSEAAPNTYGRLREIYARQGDTLQVGLDGVGFLFLGLPDTQSNGMSFKSKENKDNRTLFTFQALKLGTYDLDFLQQDNMAGKTSRETVRVHVVSDQDFDTAVAQPVAAPQGGPDPGDPLFAQKLATLGSYQAAVAELLKGYRDGNPGLNDQIAGLYMKMGSYDAAQKYYEKNLAPLSDYTPRAVVGLVKVAVVQDDQPALLSRLRQFLAVTDPGAEEPLVQAVRMEKTRGEVGMALDLAGEYTTRYPSGSWRDEVDFLTAQLLEADSPARDISRARGLYSAIVSDHPESRFADAARQRVLYIDRHFYQVR